MSQPQVGTKFEDLFAGTVDQKTGERTRVPDSVCEKLDKLTLISPKDRTLRNEYKKAYSSLRSALDGFKEFSDEKAFAKDSKDLVDAYQNYYKVSMAMATKFNGGGAKKNDISGLIGRDLQNFEINRGFISNATNAGIDKIRSVTDINNLGNDEKTFTFADLMKKQNMLEIKKEGSEKLEGGAINEVTNVKIDGKKYAAKTGKLFGKVTKDHFNPFAPMELKGEMATYTGLGYVSKKETEQLESDNPKVKLKSKTVRADNALRDQGLNTISKLLGYEIITNTSVGVSKDGLTSVMDFAKGSQVSNTFFSKDDAGKKKIEDYFERRDNDPEFKKFTEELPNTKNMNNEKIIDINDPSLQKACQELALVDIIGGQLDRHTGNFFISGEPNNMKLTGIDNDFAFGLHSVDDIDNGRTVSSNKNNATNMKNSFPIMHKDIAQKIKDIDADTIADALAGSVGMGDQGKERLEAVKTRIGELKQYVKDNENTPGFIVDEFNKDTAKTLTEKGNKWDSKGKNGTPLSPFARVARTAGTSSFIVEYTDSTHEREKKEKAEKAAVVKAKEERTPAVKNALTQAKENPMSSDNRIKAFEEAMWADQKRRYEKTSDEQRAMFEKMSNTEINEKFTQDEILDHKAKKPPSKITPEWVEATRGQYAFQRTMMAYMKPDQPEYNQKVLRAFHDRDKNNYAKDQGFVSKVVKDGVDSVRNYDVSSIDLKDPFNNIDKYPEMENMTTICHTIRDSIKQNTLLTDDSYRDVFPDHEARQDFTTKGDFIMGSANTVRGALIKDVDYDMQYVVQSERDKVENQKDFKERVKHYDEIMKRGLYGKTNFADFKENYKSKLTFDERNDEPAKSKEEREKDQPKKEAASQNRPAAAANSNEEKFKLEPDIPRPSKRMDVSDEFTGKNKRERSSAEKTNKNMKELEAISKDRGREI